MSIKRIAILVCLAGLVAVFSQRWEARPPMAEFLYETFTAANGTNVTAYTGELGGTNSNHPQMPGTVLVHNNALYGSTGPSYVITSGTPDTANYTLEAVVDVKSVISNVINNGCVLFSRMPASGINWIAVIFNGEDCAVAWNGNLESSVAAPLSVGEHVVTVSVTGTSIKIYFDGVLNQTVTASSPTLKGNVGFGWQSAITTTTGIHIKSIIAYDAVVDVPVNDSDLWCSGNWYDDGSGTMQASNIRDDATYVATVNPGAEIRIGWTAAGIVPVFENSGLVSIPDGDRPVVRYRVDAGAWSTVELSARSNTPIVIDGLSVAAHVLTIQFDHTDWTESRWSSPTNKVKIAGFHTRNAGSDALTGDYAPEAANAIFYSDSIGEGLYLESASVAGGTAAKSWTKLVADSLGCNRVNVCFGELGWSVGASAGVPKFSDVNTAANSSWRFHSAGKSRLISGSVHPADDWVFVQLGTNDSLGLSDVTDEVTAEIPRLRAAHPLPCRIVILAPFGAYAKSQIAAGYAAATKDDHTHLIDLGAAGEALPTTDGIHLTEQGHIDAADLIMDELDPIINPPVAQPIHLRSTLTPFNLSPYIL